MAWIALAMRQCVPSWPPRYWACPALFHNSGNSGNSRVSHDLAIPPAVPVRRSPRGNPTLAAAPCVQGGAGGHVTWPRNRPRHSHALRRRSPQIVSKGSSVSLRHRVSPTWPCLPPARGSRGLAPRHWRPQCRSPHRRQVLTLDRSARSAAVLPPSRHGSASRRGNYVAGA